jgi:hypothetical protein
MKPEDLNTGPGAAEVSKFQTFLANWFGNGSDESKAAAFQVLSKFLNADQMGSILDRFHNVDHAQVRLGAYESRLIIEQLAANPQMTRTAIQQMMNWEASDAKYDQNKARTAYATTAYADQVKQNQGKLLDLGHFGNYDNVFQRAKMTDTGLSAFTKPAPPYQEARLAKKDTPQNRQVFMQKFGYLPTGHGGYGNKNEVIAELTDPSLARDIEAPSVGSTTTASK